MRQTDFRPTELKFLEHYALTTSDVYDARGQPKSTWQQGARREHKTLVLGSPCAAHGHRLRTRSGHCVECDPKKIAYQRRHRAPGYVYIAGSITARLIKIGTSEDVRQREQHLRTIRYAEADDWALVFFAQVDEGGLVEHEIMSQLATWRAKVGYVKDGRPQDAAEVFHIKYSKALRAVASVLQRGSFSNKWQSPTWRQYEFT